MGYQVSEQLSALGVMEPVRLGELGIGCRKIARHHQAGPQHARGDHAIAIVIDSARHPAHLGGMALSHRDLAADMAGGP